MLSNCTEYFWTTRATTVFGCALMKNVILVCRWNCSKASVLSVSFTFRAEKKWAENQLQAARTEPIWVSIKMMENQTPIFVRIGFCHGNRCSIWVMRFLCMLMLNNACNPCRWRTQDWLRLALIQSEFRCGNPEITRSANYGGRIRFLCAADMSAAGNEVVHMSNCLIAIRFSYCIWPLITVTRVASCLSNCANITLFGESARDSRAEDAAKVLAWAV